MTPTLDLQRSPVYAVLSPPEEEQEIGAAEELRLRGGSGYWLLSCDGELRYRLGSGEVTILDRPLFAGEGRAIRVPPEGVQVMAAAVDSEVRVWAEPLANSLGGLE